MSIFKRIHKGISVLLVMALIIGGVPQNVLAIENEPDAQETSKDSADENVKIDTSSEDAEQGNQVKEKQQEKEKEKTGLNKEENKPKEDKANEDVNSNKEEKNKADTDKESKEIEKEKVSQEEKEQEKEKTESNKEENKPIEDKASEEVNSKKEEKNKVDTDKESKEIEEVVSQEAKQEEKEKTESNKEENKPVEDKASEEVNSNKEEKNKADTDKESKEIEKEKVSQEAKQEEKEKEKTESNKEENKPVEDKTNEEVNSKKEEKNKADVEKEEREASIKKLQNTIKTDIGLKENYTEESLKVYEDVLNQAKNIDLEKDKLEEINNIIKQLEESIKNLEEKKVEIIPDGLYEVEREATDKDGNPSPFGRMHMGEKLKYEVKNGTHYAELRLRKIEWSKINGIKVDGKVVECEREEEKNCEDPHGGSEKVTDQLIKFEVPNQKSKIIIQGALLPDGDEAYAVTYTVHLKIKEDTFKKVEEEKPNPQVETISDGLYEVEREATDEDRNPSPFARMHIGEKLKYEVKNEKHYVELRLRKSEWSKINEIKVDKKVVEYDDSKEEKNCEDPYKISETVTDKLIKFEVPNQKSEIIIQGAILPDGDEAEAVPCTVYLKIKEDTFKKIEEEKPNTDFNKDGLYQINLKRLHAEKDEVSMAAGYIEKIANIEVKNGKKTCIVTLKRSDWMYYIKMEVNGQEVPHELKVIKTYDQLNEKGNNQTDSIMRFEIPEADAKIRMYLKAIPMGDDEKVFRIVPQKDTANYLGDKTDGEREVAIRRLQNAIEAKIDPEENYTKESYKVYKEALNQAKNIDVEKKSTEEISSIAEVLEKAIATLKIREDIIKYEGKVTNSNKDLNWIMKDKGTIQIIDEKKYVEIALEDVPGFRIDKISVDGKIVKHSERKEGEYIFVKYEVKNIESEMILTVPVMYDPWYVEGKIVFDDETIKKVKEYDKNQLPEEGKPAKDINKSGLYKTEVKAMKENEEAPSMAGTYLEKDIQIEVKDGKKIVTATLNRSDWMKDIQVTIDGKEVKSELTEIARNEKDETKSTIKFEIPSLESKIKFHMNVVPMGNARVAFRFVPKKDTLKLIEEYKEEKPEDINKSGLYKAEVKAMKENEEAPSMAGTYLEKDIQIEVKDGKKIVTATLNRSDWMKDIQVTIDGKEVKSEIKEIERNEQGETKSTIKFEIPSLEKEIKFHMNVVPMGNARVAFRFVPQKDTLKIVKEYEEEKPQTNIDITKDGEYEANIEILNQEKPMIKNVLENRVRYVVEGDKKHIQLLIKSAGAAMLKVEGVYVDEKQVDYKRESIDGLEVINFEIKDIDSKIIVDAKFMGSSRIVINKNSFRKIEKEIEKPIETELYEIDIKEFKMSYDVDPSRMQYVLKNNARYRVEKYKDGKEKKYIELIGHCTGSDMKSGQFYVDGVAVSREIKKVDEKFIAAVEVDSIDSEIEFEHVNIGPGSFKMGKVRIILDKNTLEDADKVRETKEAAVKRLEEVLGEKVEKEKYTEESYQVYEYALNNAKAINEEIAKVEEINRVAEVKEINKAVESLEKAIKGLKTKLAEEKEKAIESLEEVIGKKVEEKEKYTEKSYKAYEEALKVAKAVDKEATVEEINKAVESLEKAIKGLKTKLAEEKEKAIESLEEVIGKKVEEKEKYTEESYKAYKEALKAAKAVDKEATVEEINKAVESLEKAIAGLKTKLAEEKEKALKSLEEVIGKKVEEKEKYTEESYKAYKEALKAAKAVDKLAEVEEINKAVENLEKAIKDLKIKEVVVEKPVKDLSKNGEYKINVKALHAEKEESSMAGTYLDEVAQIEVKDGKYIVTAILNRSDWMKNIKVTIDGKTVAHELKEIERNEQEETTSTIKFEIPNLESKIKFHMNVVPMGNARVAFRFIPQKDTLRLIKEYEEEGKPAKDINKSGLYKAEVKAMKEKEEEPSMAGTYLEKDIQIEVKDRKQIIIATLNRSDWMKNIEVTIDGKAVAHELKEIARNEQQETTSTIKFEIPNLESKIKFHMNVVPMSNARVAFRFIPQKDTLRLIKEYDKEENKEKIIEISAKAPTQVEIADKEKNIVISKITEEIIKNGELKINVGNTKNATVKVPVEGKNRIKLPKTSMKSNVADVMIPAGINIKAQNKEWNGTIKLPTLIENESIKIANVKPEKVVEVGFEGGKLTFDKAVRVVLKGQTGKKAGYIENGKVIEIKNILSEDTQKAADSMKWQDAKVDNGKDLIIWTKHFTKFVAYKDDTTGGTTGDQGNNKDSKFYKVDVELLQGDTNQQSVGEKYIGKKAIYEETDGKKYIKLVVKRTDQMKPIKATIDGKRVKGVDPNIVKNEGGETVSTFRFEVPSLSSEIEVILTSKVMSNVPTKFKICFNEGSMRETTNPDDLDYSLDGLRGKLDEVEDLNLDGLDIKVLKENEDSPSMARGYIGEKAGFEVRDGKKYIKLHLKRSDWMKNIEVEVNGKKVKTELEEIKKNGKGETESTIEFEIPNLDAKIKFHMTVVPMGNARKACRIVLQKNTLSDNAKASLGEGEKVSNIDKNKDDLYQANIKVLKENQDKPSIAKDYIDEKVDIKVKDKKVYMIMYLKKSKDIKDLEIKVEGKTVKHEMKEIKEHVEGKADSFVKFEIPEFESKIVANMKIQGDKNQKVTFRVVPQKDTLVKKVMASVTKDGFYEMNMEVVDKYQFVLAVAKKHLINEIDIEEKDGKKYVQVLLKEKDEIKDMEIFVDGKKVEYENVNEKIKASEEKFAAIRFEIPSLDSKIKFNILTKENDQVNEKENQDKDKKSNKKEEKKYVAVNVVLKKDTMKQIESKVYLYVGSKNIYKVNSEGTEKITLDVAPAIQMKRTLVPLKGVCEALGVKLSWQEETRGVLLSKDDTNIQLHIDSKDAKIGEESMKLEVAPRIINDRTFVPLRFMSESLEYDVKWVKEENKIVVTKKADVDQKKENVDKKKI